MDNNQSWPPEVSESLQRWILDSRAPAFLVTDNRGRLLAQGGELSHYGLADLHAGDRVAERAYLVVEDQDGVRHLVCDVLTGLGYAVLECADSSSRLRGARNTPEKSTCC